MDVLQELRDYAAKNYVPIIREESGKFLCEQIASLKPARVLEIGTAIGYSGSLILSVCSKTRLTTIEKDEARFEIAKSTFLKQNLSDRVELILADAKDALKTLLNEGRKFDFVFLDGPKGQYLNYLPLIKGLLAEGGVLFADNINHDGLVLSDQDVRHKSRSMIVNLRKFVAAVTADPDLKTKIYNIEDGVLVAKKIFKKM